jgi:hypothetical protein
VILLVIREELYFPTNQPTMSMQSTGRYPVKSRMASTYISLVGGMLVVLALTTIVQAYVEWRDAQYVLPDQLISAQRVGARFHIAFVSVLGAIGAIAGGGVATRRMWAPILVGLSGGASFALAGCSLWRSGPMRIEMVTRAVSTGYPRVAVQAGYSLALDVLSIVLWSTVMVLVLLKGPSVGFPKSNGVGRRLLVWVSPLVSIAAFAAYRLVLSLM